MRKAVLADTNSCKGDDVIVAASAKDTDSRQLEKR